MKSSVTVSSCIVVIAFLLSCKKHNAISSCESLSPITSDPLTREVIGDSSIVTDTAFVGSIIFEAVGNPKQTEWKIGDDPRIYTSPKFLLKFDYPVSSIGVNLIVKGDVNSECFPNDDGIDAANRLLTILPRDTSTRTPLIGDYLGSVQGRSSDTFTVSVNFWTNPKYKPYVGPQPFCTISNFPKGYRDTTSSIGTRFPELSYGYMCDWGYRAIYINEDYKDAQNVKGYAYLTSKDTLIIDFSRADLTANYIPGYGYPRLKEKFIGIRKK